MMVTQQLAFGVLGILNVYVLWLLNRRTKASDEHVATHRDIETRLAILSGQTIPEETFRKILKEELQVFELRLINEGRLDPQKKRRQTNERLI